MLKIPSQISKVETTSDKGLKLIVHTTQELMPSDEADVFQMKPKDRLGRFLGKSNEKRSGSGLRLCDSSVKSFASSEAYDVS